MEIGEFGESYKRFEQAEKQLARLIAKNGVLVFGQDGGLGFDDGPGDNLAELSPYKPSDSGGESPDLDTGRFSALLIK